MQKIILDAYNVIHKIPKLSKKLDISLEAAREGLIQYMVSWKARTSFAGEVVLVFDGDSSMLDIPTYSQSGIKVIFSKGKDADDKISDLLRLSKDTSKTIVVSGDNKVANHTRAFNASIKPVSYLASPRVKINPKNAALPASKNIGYSDASSITNEQLNRFGLKPKGR